MTKDLLLRASWKQQNLFQLHKLLSRIHLSLLLLSFPLQLQPSKVKIKRPSRSHRSRKNRIQLPNLKKWRKLLKEKKNHAARLAHDNWLTKQTIHAGKELPIKLRNVGIIKRNKKASSQPIQPNTHQERTSTRDSELLGSQLRLITMEDARVPVAKRFYTWDRDTTILSQQITIDWISPREVRSLNS